ncbi:MAG: glycosyltransferase family 1 protein [Campylobacterota bacterium]|nr:glycosyltransferase family 1 protein [Campylobacterota bacterium]
MLFTDTIGDLNGVSRFLQDMAENALLRGDDLQVITSTAKQCPEKGNIHNFPPQFRMRMPYYQELDLAFPPGDLIESFVNNNLPDLIHISTPGPVGMLGKKIAKKFGINVIGTYHTDFPAYIRDNTGSKLLKRMTDRWMERFYKKFIHIFSRSEIYGEIMQKDIRIAPEKISYIRPGTNLKRFSPNHRHERVWELYGFSGQSVKVLYVGRMTKEKNVPFLLDVWEKLKEQYPDLNVELALIGEGSCHQRALALKSIGVHALGPVVGDELSHFYASADIFVFPSVTDTLGQVVMESAASGLPVVVSTVGGPKSLINPERPSGYAVNTGDMDLWVDHLRRLIDEKQLRESLGESGKSYMQSFPIEHSYEDFWGVHQRYYDEQA